MPRMFSRAAEVAESTFGILFMEGCAVLIILLAGHRNLQCVGMRAYPVILRAYARLMPHLSGANASAEDCDSPMAQLNSNPLIRLILFEDV